jgi:hypothetical protein
MVRMKKWLSVLLLAGCTVQSPPPQYGYGQPQPYPQQGQNAYDPNNPTGPYDPNSNETPPQQPQPKRHWQRERC